MTRSDPLNQGAFFNPKEGWPPGDRTYMNMPSDTRLPTAASQPICPHPRPQSISNALRDCVRLPAREFALVVVLDNGELQTFTSSTLSKSHGKIFSDGFKSTFSHAVRRATAEGSFGSTTYGQEGGMYNQFEYDGGNDTQQSSTSSSDSSRGFHKNSRSDENDVDGSTTKRARRRYGGRTRDNTSDDALTPVPSRKNQILEIGNSSQVEEFYLTRFKDMQQTACKIMGKVFVKLVEPKKQTHHPYTRGDESAPPWWPTQPGEHYVRHKEPDHLYKKERIRLLVHILRMIVLPHEKQHLSVQKVALTVRKLEEATNEAMSTWFGDNDHPENKTKRVFLKEIFRVARLEERFFNGEVDAVTNIPVMFGDRGNGDESEDEGLAYDTPPASHDGHGELNSMVASIPTPESIPMVSPPLSQHDQIHPTQTDPMRMRQLPHRYSAPMDSQHTFGEHNYFPRIDTFQQSSAIPDPLRRTFTSPDYHNNQHNGLGWQQQQPMVSASPGSGSYYAQSSLPPASGPMFQMSHTLPPPQSLIAPNLSSHFNGLPLPSGSYDPNPAPVPGMQFRTGSLSHPHQVHPHGFEGYLHSSETQFNHNVEEMKEEPQQPPPPQHHHMQHAQ